MIHKPNQAQPTTKKQILITTQLSIGTNHLPPI
jgi:hypothetical protein